MRSLRAERSNVIPGRFCVYDFDAGEIARDEAGRLAYFDTMAQARAFVADHFDDEGPAETVVPVGEWL